MRDLVWRGVLRCVLGAKRLGVFARALLFGVHGGVVPLAQSRRQRTATSYSMSTREGQHDKTHYTALNDYTSHRLCTI